MAAARERADFVEASMAVLEARKRADEEESAAALRRAQADLVAKQAAEERAQAELVALQAAEQRALAEQAAARAERESALEQQMIIATAHELAEARRLESELAHREAEEMARKVVELEESRAKRERAKAGLKRRQGWMRYGMAAAAVLGISAVAAQWMGSQPMTPAMASAAVSKGQVLVQASASQAQAPVQTAAVLQGDLFTPERGGLNLKLEAKLGNR